MTKNAFALTPIAVSIGPAFRPDSHERIATCKYGENAWFQLGRPFGRIVTDPVEALDRKGRFRAFASAMTDPQLFLYNRRNHGVIRAHFRFGFNRFRSASAIVAMTQFVIDGTPTV